MEEFDQKLFCQKLKFRSVCLKILNWMNLSQKFQESLGNSMFLMTGSKCSKMSFTLASMELSVTIDPSLLRKNTPPMMFLWDSSRLKGLRANLLSIYLPVYLCMISVKDLSHLLNTD